MNHSKKNTIPILCCAECENPLSITTHRGSYCMPCGYAPSMQDTFFARISPCCAKKVVTDGNLYRCPECSRTFTG